MTGATIRTVIPSGRLDRESVLYKTNTGTLTEARAGLIQHTKNATIMLNTSQLTVASTDNEPGMNHERQNEA